jgi:gluconolactonase
MAVGADGDLWVALTGGHRVDHLSPTGDLLGSVALADGSLPTNVCVGRRDGELYVAASFHQALLRVQL